MVEDECFDIAETDLTLRRRFKGKVLRLVIRRNKMMFSLC